MRLVSALLLLSTALPTTLLAEDIPLTSAVRSVTLYPQGATVTRAVPFSAPAGRHDLILTDLPRGTDLSAVRVSVEGATMGGLTARNDFVPPRDEADDAAIEAAEARVEAAEEALREGMAGVADIMAERDAAQARVAFLTQIGQGDGVAQMEVSALRDLAAMIGDETLAARRAAQDAERRAEAAERGLKDLREDLEKARQALAALVPEAEARAMLAVAISAEGATEGSVTVTYTISDAGWRPVYDFRLDRAAGRLTVERGAFVTQSTGENWQDVALALSTVRPTEQTVPSEIWPEQRWIVDEEEDEVQPLMRAPVAEMSAADQAFAGAAAPKRIAVQAMYDGLSVTYDYPDPVSIASGADHVRLDLGPLEMEAELVAQAVPLSDANAYLMASVTNEAEDLILPTPEANFYLDGRFQGQRFIELIPAGGEADLSFGPIEGLRLTRTVLDRAEGDRGVISKSNEMTETVRIDVENLTGETWPMRVLDRVPYSEQEDLRIDWKAEPAATETDVDGQRGILAWEFDLAPGAEQTIVLEQSLKWPDGMLLR